MKTPDLKDVKVDLIEAIPGTILLTFENSYEMNMTLLRMQEFYESPKYKDRFFTLEEYMDWYVYEYDKPKDGSLGFYYLEQVLGCNVPGDVVTRFLEIFDDPALHPADEMRCRERWFRRTLIKALRSFPEKWCKRARVSDLLTQPYYVIAVYGDEMNAIDHEMAHARYHLDDEYREQVDDIVCADWSDSLVKALKDVGYSSSVYVDEVHAFALTGWGDFYPPSIRDDASTRVQRRLRRAFPDWRYSKLKTI